MAKVLKKDNGMRVVFRADGSRDTGLGHIYRSLALVDMLKEEFGCVFMVNRPSCEVLDLIESYCDSCALSFNSLNEEIEEITQKLLPTDIFVTDGYDFDMKYQQVIKSKVKKLVMIDDKANHYYHADLIINHGDPSIESKYRKQIYTRVLSGFSYSIMRKEFLTSATIEKKVTKVDTVFVCMGGSDPFNLTIRALSACLKAEFIKSVIVITGNAYGYQVDLKKTLESNIDKAITHEENVSAQRMVELITKSEIAIAPASSIAMEICSVKAGLLSGTVIDNQQAIHKQLLDSGCCISLGNFNKKYEKDISRHLEKLNNTDQINSIMKNQSIAIDGLSGERILVEFKKLVA